MPAKDIYHDCVKNALIKDGWKITDPGFLTTSLKTLCRGAGEQGRDLYKFFPLCPSAPLDFKLVRNAGDDPLSLKIGKKDIFIDLAAEKLLAAEVWIQSDNTENGIANELVQAGIPKEDIVLEFHEPNVRKYTGFAVA
ncbi:element excision factor XisI family protein [Nostoc sp.]|uniref:element excision factor XisI family protein n=1 Tax=Nostoc sp. TaxID=1180 RepID=UPI002FEFD4F6